MDIYFPNVSQYSIEQEIDYNHPSYNHWYVDEPNAMQCTFPRISTPRPLVRSKYIIETCTPYGETDAYIGEKPKSFILPGTEEIKQKLDSIDKVYINNGVTVLIDKLGQKTIVRAQDGERPDVEKGLYMALLRRYLTPKRYHEMFAPHYKTPNVEKKIAYSLLIFIYGKNEVDKFVASAIERNKHD